MNLYLQSHPHLWQSTNTNGFFGMNYISSSGYETKDPKNGGYLFQAIDNIFYDIKNMSWISK